MQQYLWCSHSFEQKAEAKKCLQYWSSVQEWRAGWMMQRQGEGRRNLILNGNFLLKDFTSEFDKEVCEGCDTT